MSSLRECARDVQEVAQDGIGWIVLWKVGKSWHTHTFWPENFDTSTLSMEVKQGDFGILEAAMKVNADAIVVNGYYDNLFNVTEEPIPSTSLLALSGGSMRSANRYCPDGHSLPSPEQRLLVNRPSPGLFFLERFFFFIFLREKGGDAREEKYTQNRWRYSIISGTNA